MNQVPLFSSLIMELFAAESLAIDMAFRVKRINKAIVYTTMYTTMKLVTVSF